jgi:hypothetical protein
MRELGYFYEAEEENISTGEGLREQGAVHTLARNSESEPQPHPRSRTSMPSSRRALMQ